MEYDLGPDASRERHGEFAPDPGRNAEEPSHGQHHPGGPGCGPQWREGGHPEPGDEADPADDDQPDERLRAPCPMDVPADRTDDLPHLLGPVRTGDR